MGSVPFAHRIRQSNAGRPFKRWNARRATERSRPIFRLFPWQRFLKRRPHQEAECRLSADVSRFPPRKGEGVSDQSVGASSFRFESSGGWGRAARARLGWGGGGV